MRGYGWSAGAGAALVALLAAFGPVPVGGAQPAAAQAGTVDRSPTDVAVTRDGRWAITANQTAGTASLIDVAAGRVVDEAHSGDGPVAVSLSSDGRRAVVSNSTSETLAHFDVSPAGLRKTGEVRLGFQPRGVALTADGRRAYVALTLGDEVAAVELPGGRVSRVAVGARPWFVALSPDESRLAVGGSRSREVTLLSCPELRPVGAVKLAGASADNLRQIAFSPDGKWAYVPHQVTRGLPTTRNNIDNGWVIASRASRVRADGEGPRESLALDTRGRAVGDPYGLALSPDGEWLAMSASGTRELLLFRLPLPFFGYGGPGDMIEPELLRNDGRFRRVPLGGRPLGIRFTSDSRSVCVANYLENSLQIVDVEAGAVRQTIHLGGGAEPSPERRGEALFYDATRSFNQWFSCGSCHVEGHTNRQTYDTFNDGQYGNGAKTTPSLRHVADTGPWTWHGWQTSLPESISSSFLTTMHGRQLAEGEASDLLAFLRTLRDPRNPHRPTVEASPAQRRGEQLFKTKAACAACHSGATFTDGRVHDVGLGAVTDRHRGFNPPSLLGVYDRAPFLHDGRSATLEDLLEKHHTPEKLGGAPLTASERADLVEYLKSL